MSTTEEVSATTSFSSSENSKKKKWFATRPEDAMPFEYNKIVSGAHLRHILVHTKEMADLAMKTYVQLRQNDNEEEKEEHSMDPFGWCAKSLSICEASKENNGRIGWVDNPLHSSTKKVDENGNILSNEEYHSMLPQEAIHELFTQRPKGGDILQLQSKMGWHVIMIDDLLVKYIPTSGYSNKISRVDGKKLSGRGLPRKPHDPTDSKYYQIITMGCQMNVADTERMEGVLQNHLQLDPMPDPQPKQKAEKPDVVVFNTCSIRDHAEQKLYDALGPIAARKRNGEAVSLIVAGCVAQQEGQDLIKRFPEIDLVMGPQYVNRLDTLLEDVGNGHQIVATDPTLIMEDDWSRPPVRGSDLRAWVNIIYGCNEHCTYCVVPNTRGVEQSRSMEHILQEVQALEREGYKEITLLGQNIDAYGRDMNPKRNFADLLQFLNDRVSSIERIRYVTSHPRYFSDRVIDAVANLDRVCECFHMPFQSGDDEVLKGMRRGYTHDSYMRIIDKIKQRAPDASISGDVIVGFPGETDEAFQRTLDIMEKVKFDNLNTYAYSPRPNTEAADWPNQIPDAIKSERLQIIQRVGTQHALERSQRYVGTTVEVLVEELNPKNKVQVMGRTRQNKLVFFDGELDALRGKLVHVEIEEARPWSLTGKMVG